ncbi:MAG: glycosyltransferase family 8 protein [Synergistaceae bacterium]|nr:glycosyltransferase family 8 protein [Synergistaceae bacterium]
MMVADNKYAPYAGVMLQSIIENANPNKNYDIAIVSGEITDKNKKMLESMARPNVSVRVIDISGIVDSIDAGMFYIHSHFTVETYYRFFIPKLFAKYDKVLYLDCDMVSLRDIADLYETNIGGNWWGAARENMISCLGFTDGTFEKRKLLPYMKDTLKMDSPFDYFQAGVMIWNVRACVKDDVTDKLLARLKEIGKPYYPDQDVMNSLANGKHIHWLSQNWNVAWCVPFLWWKGEGTEAYKTAMHLLENPFILHYCSHIKPWIETSRPNAHYFWKFARKTPFYEIIVKAEQLSAEKERKIKKLTRKARKYKVLQVLTVGLVKSFRLRKNKYRNEIKQVEEMYN